MDIKSEQSVRLGEAKKQRPKTAYKEVSKPGEPGVGDIVVHKKTKPPISQDKEIELARKKLFKKLKEDKMKKKQIINKAVKKHVAKPPKVEAPVKRPKSGKVVKEKEVEVDENDYEQFLNGKLPKF